MENDEMKELLTKIDKKLDKILNLNTKIAKALHLLPVSEKEERDLQIQQRTNLNIAAKVNAELDDMQNKNEDKSSSLIDVFNNATENFIYDDVIASDMLPTQSEEGGSK